MSVIDEARDLLKRRPRTMTYAEIEKDTGIKESWLKAFACGNLENPSFITIESLVKYLSGKDIKVG